MSPAPSPRRPGVAPAAPAARPPRRPAASRCPPLEGACERLALFTATFAPDRAARLLEQLSDGLREEALQHARRLASLDPPSRQGRVARAFGERPDAGQRLRALLAEARPGLARAIQEGLPAHHRERLATPPRSGPLPEPLPAQRTLAARLIKEALS